jgi:transposase
VQDLETGEVIWSFDGHGDGVLELFFLSLTAQQCAEIEYVVADGARWITRQVEKFCPNAIRCVDPFHVVMWANNSLDEVRKAAVKQAKKDAGEGKKAERSKKKTIPNSKNMPC